jgi:hypothetical protein
MSTMGNRMNINNSILPFWRSELQNQGFSTAFTRQCKFCGIDPLSSADHWSVARPDVLSCALDDLDAKGILQHTDYRVERYYLVYTG